MEIDIFCKYSKMMVFPKEISQEHGLSRIAREVHISFFQKYDLSLDGK